MVLLLDQAADGQRERRVRRDPRLDRRGRGGAKRKLVEAVPDRDQLARVVPGALEEVADGVGDRDQPSRASREAAVDVAERPEQVAVIVVPRRDDRDACQPRRNRPVHVRVDEVRVQEVGPLGAHGADHVASEARRGVEPAAHAPVRHAELVQPLVEDVRILPGTSSPRKRASIPRSRRAGSSASRWPSEPLTPVSLCRWRTFTSSRR